MKRIALFGIAMMALSQSWAAGDHCITKEQAFGCKSKEDFDEIASLTNDTQALGRALLVGYASGLCKKFHAGQSVFVKDRSWVMVQVRLPGELAGYWMPMEWVDTSNCPAQSADSGEAADRPLAPLPEMARPPEQRTGWTPHAFAIEPTDADKKTAKEAEEKRLRALREQAEKPKCVVKDVMTDEDIAMCRAAAGH